MSASTETQELDQALKPDPDFVPALAYRGGVTPGPEGTEMVEDARAKASSVSQPERLLIDALWRAGRANSGRSAVC